MLEKLKPYLADDALFYGVFLTLVAGTSFFLGRYSVETAFNGENIENKGRIEVLAPAPVVPAPGASSTPSAVTEATLQPASVITAVVGSKSGTKYHLPDCPGAKRIKSENLITFESIDAAKAAGYGPAANCPGLQ